MTKTLVCTAFCLFLALPAFADTRTGNANGTSIHKWEIYNVESGEIKITLSWTRAAAKTNMLLVCTSGGDALSFGIAAGNLNRYAEIVSGVIAGTTCVIGVYNTAGTGATAYRIHFNLTSSDSSSPDGRTALFTPVPPASPAEMETLNAHLEQEVQKLRMIEQLAR